jgi:prepilin-type N-terminal cleavage/methylation domain-containing protein
MKRHKNGFTLIETILVIIVLGIASYGLLNVFISGLKKSAYPLKGVQAVTLAKEKLEIIMADKHDALKGYPFLIAANYSDETPVAGFSDFDRTVSFLEVDSTDLSAASPGSGFKKITVTVSWDKEDVSLVSLVTDY